ncbi:hypothetical protein E5Q_03897 [Mixia osmundae IAM 14324]|uniref:Uncharacterized protein n=1 Tax=Mixia osmundae (strain CBS 9802 / IAM 14324 / JCM 22182 / KY 12970) TaxID=764103 RepID=G7E340_MIXOS|nr:hypothetical protein E5Q_03897 [Mixia osmundae IAM 14324]
MKKGRRPGLEFVLDIVELESQSSDTSREKFAEKSDVVRQRNDKAESHPRPLVNQNFVPTDIDGAVACVRLCKARLQDGSSRRGRAP